MAEKSWHERMRMALDLVAFHLPIEERFGAESAIKEISGGAINRSQTYGMAHMFAFASLLQATVLGGEADPLHGDVDNAVANLGDGPINDMVEQLRENGVWAHFFDVARGAIAAFEHSDDFFGGGIGSPERSEIIRGRLEAEAIARAMEGIEGANFLYGLAQLFANLAQWEQRLYAKADEWRRRARSRES